MNRAGFTLLELMVAMVIGASAVAGAAALYVALGSRADAIETTSRAVSRAANAERLLRVLVANVRSRPGAPGVRGDARAVALDTRCETELGWTVPCRVLLSFDPRGGRERLLLRRPDATGRDSAGGAAGDPWPTSAVVLRDSVGRGAFAYLVDPAHGGSWSETWAEDVPPPAIAVVIERDTLLLSTR